MLHNGNEVTSLSITEKKINLFTTLTFSESSEEAQTKIHDKEETKDKGHIRVNWESVRTGKMCQRGSAVSSISA